LHASPAFSRPLVGVSLVAAMAAPVSLSAQAINRSPTWAAQSGIRAAYDRGFQEGSVTARTTRGLDGPSMSDGTTSIVTAIADTDARTATGIAIARNSGADSRKAIATRSSASRIRLRPPAAVQRRVSSGWRRRQRTGLCAGIRGWLRQGAGRLKDRHRYDPLRHGDYKDGDNGYNRDYGSKDAYKQYYREGFRSGYEDGYRGRRPPRRSRLAALTVGLVGQGPQPLAGNPACYVLSAPRSS
jgi:hypothetical protein